MKSNNKSTTALLISAIVSITITVLFGTYLAYDQKVTEVTLQQAIEAKCNALESPQHAATIRN